METASPETKPSSLRGTLPSTKHTKGREFSTVGNGVRNHNHVGIRKYYLTGFLMDANRSIGRSMASRTCRLWCCSLSMSLSSIFTSFDLLYSRYKKCPIFSTPVMVLSTNTFSPHDVNAKWNVSLECIKKITWGVLTEAPLFSWHGSRWWWMAV